MKNNNHPSDDDAYRVPAGIGEAVLVEKKSKFIATIWPAAAESEALARLADARKRHRDAAHNVYAFIIRKGVVRCSDDGEPQGTSGPPVLQVLEGHGLYDVCCIVTRYFGGTLLGAGGLARAYSGAAKAAVDNAGIAVMRLWSRILFACPYSFYEQARQLVGDSGGGVVTADFGVDVMMEALLPAPLTAAFGAGLAERSAGKVTMEVVDRVFRPGISGDS